MTPGAVPVPAPGAPQPSLRAHAVHVLGAGS